eukprot:CAMPEP_0181177546 /NCGR_PEP_ID=MMETSP1096-20121128/5224_1 /TAXON_ID=156174 ORGANISM="Chrysochromulina ericina, Strain CCMP281" /NCGR_SAMPLE_ID=MMETSP1096 /ASSEMBLY_ACC=CAM_ASM_000453 /LENGTH=224 /DNA_ID=CAMNT_0023265715 /DNA_START=279 /DNA_END=950 /DNA_ORIENTATION=+
MRFIQLLFMDHSSNGRPTEDPKLWLVHLKQWLRGRKPPRLQSRQPDGVLFTFEPTGQGGALLYAGASNPHAQVPHIAGGQRCVVQPQQHVLKRLDDKALPLSLCALAHDDAAPTAQLPPPQRLHPQVDGARGLVVIPQLAAQVCGAVWARARPVAAHPRLIPSHVMHHHRVLKRRGRRRPPLTQRTLPPRHQLWCGVPETLLYVEPLWQHGDMPLEEARKESLL